MLENQARRVMVLHGSAYRWGFLHVDRAGRQMNLRDGDKSAIAWKRVQKACLQKLISNSEEENRYLRSLD